MVKLKRETGGLLRNSYPGRASKGKLDPYKGWVSEIVEEQGDITFAEASITYYLTVLRDNCVRS